MPPFYMYHNMAAVPSSFPQYGTPTAIIQIPPVTNAHTGSNTNQFPAAPKLQYGTGSYYENLSQVCCNSILRFIVLLFFGLFILAEDFLLRFTVNAMEVQACHLYLFVCFCTQTQDFKTGYGSASQNQNKAGGASTGSATNSGTELGGYKSHLNKVGRVRHHLFPFCGWS